MNDVIEELSNAIIILNRVDEYKNTLTDKLSEQDKKLSDLYHCIENNKLTTAQCYRMIKEIKMQRGIRRKIKKDMSIFSVYDRNINKLINENNRNLLMSEIYKTEKRLNTEYQNRIYTEEEINKIIGVR